MSSSLQERTLVVKGYDPNKTSKELLEELFIQGGPVRNIVYRPDHSFVEYEDKESVGYALALFKGLELFKRSLIIEPKLNEPSYFKYLQDLDIVYNSLMMERNLVANIIPPMATRQMMYNQLPPQFVNQINHQNPTMFIQPLLPGTSNLDLNSMRRQSGGFVTMDPDRVYYPQTQRAPRANHNRPRPHHHHRNKRWSN